MSFRQHEKQKKRTLNQETEIKPAYVKFVIMQKSKVYVEQPHSPLNYLLLCLACSRVVFITKQRTGTLTFSANSTYLAGNGVDPWGINCCAGAPGTGSCQIHRLNLILHGSRTMQRDSIGNQPLLECGEFWTNLYITTYRAATTWNYVLPY